MERNLTTVITPLLSIGLRVSGLVMFAPVLGGAAVPMRIKAVLVLAITTALYPVLQPQVATVMLSRWPLIVIHELAIGIAVGMAANLLFDAMQVAGQILSVQMGYSLVNILDPQTQVESTALAVFHQTIAILIFLGLNVHHALLRVVAATFEYLPVDGITLNAPFAAATLKLGAMMLALGVQIAAPVLAATILADVVIGLMGKASPQMPLILLGPAVKSVLGAAVFLGVMRYWPKLLESGFRDSLTYAERLLHLAR